MECDMCAVAGGEPMWEVENDGSCYRCGSLLDVPVMDWTPPVYQPPPPPPPVEKPRPSSTYYDRKLAEVELVCERMELDGSLQRSAARFLMQYYRAVVARTGKSPAAGEPVSSAGVTATASALVYLACRESCVPRSYREVAKASGQCARQVFRRYIKIWNEIGKAPAARNKAEQFLPRFCGRLNRPFSVEKRARELARASSVTTAPPSLAAAAILASDPSLTAKEVAEISGVSKPTLLKLRKKLQLPLSP